MITSSIHDNKGFTLVELAMGLTVIGLLIGGVLMGQELIKNAHITNIVKDLNDIDKAVMVFRSIYGDDLPGDTQRPTRIPGCTNAACTQTIYVNSVSVHGNWLIEHYPAGHESHRFWNHLDKAGLIRGGFNEANTYMTASPQNAFKGHFIAWNMSPTGSEVDDHPHVNVISVSSESFLNTAKLQCAYMAAIDTKMDDGKPNTGTIKPSFISQISQGSNGCYDSATLQYPDKGNGLIFIALPSMTIE